MNTSRPKNDGGSEAFSLDAKGKKVDAHIHEPILDNPEADQANMAGYLDRLREDGVSEETIASIAESMNMEKKALGGPARMAGGGDASFFTNQAYRNNARQGMIRSVVPGRTDKIPMKVPGGSYILPADIVSGLGQGNSMAGAQALNKMFKMGPYGAATHGLSTPKVNVGRPMAQKSALSIRQRFAEGGEMEAEAPQPEATNDDGTPIIVAGGEYTLSPEVVRQLGNGDLKQGHDILDQLVLSIRKQTINEMRKLKGPKGAKS